MNLSRNTRWAICLMATATLLTFAVSPAFAFSSAKNAFNTRYGTANTAIDSCGLCHPGGTKTGGGSAPDLNLYGQDFFNNGASNSTSFAAIEGLDSDHDGFTNIDEITARTFPGDANSKPVIVGPVCTDADGDGFAIEGGACGVVDCNDNNAAIKPNAAEACTDTIDNDCDGLVDRADPNAVNCPPLCTDNDKDGYAIEGGACGPVDCNDSNAAVKPGAVESCTDKIDNNCNSLIDEADPNAVNCPVVPPPTPTCTDADNDGFYAEGGTCGPADCNDANPLVNPSAAEDCTDAIDNNCNNLVDAADPAAQACPAACTDADGDGYAIEGGNCGPVDCNDSKAAINPGATENCTDSIDNDCDSLIDVADPNARSCPVVCTDADGDGYAIEGGSCGPVDPNDSNASIVPGSGNNGGNNGGDDDDDDDDRPALSKDQLKQISNYQKQLSKLKSSLAKEQSSLQNAQKIVASYQAQLQAAQAKLDEITGSTTPLTKAQQKLVKSYAKQIGKIKKSMAKYQGTLNSAPGRIAGYQSQIQAIEDKIDSIQGN